MEVVSTPENTWNWRNQGPTTFVDVQSATICQFRAQKYDKIWLGDRQHATILQKQFWTNIYLPREWACIAFWCGASKFPKFCQFQQTKIMVCWAATLKREALLYVFYKTQFSKIACLWWYKGHSYSAGAPSRRLHVLLFKRLYSFSRYIFMLYWKMNMEFSPGFTSVCRPVSQWPPSSRCDRVGLFQYAWWIWLEIFRPKNLCLFLRTLCVSAWCNQAGPVCTVSMEKTALTEMLALQNSAVCQYYMPHMSAT